MSITKFDGSIKVVKMPPIIDPIQNEKVNAELTHLNSQNNLGVGSSPDNSYQNNNDEA